MTRPFALVAVAFVLAACSESTPVPTSPNVNSVSPRSDFSAAGLGATYDFEGDFGASASPFLPNRTDNIPSDTYTRGGKGFLGKFTNSSVTMSTDYVGGGYINYDLYIEGTWDGLSPSRFGHDLWQVSAYCGTEATGTPAGQFLTSFSNKSTTKQSYPAAFGAGVFPGRTGAINIDELGFAPTEVRTTNHAVSAYDAVYPMSLPFPAACATAGAVTWMFSSTTLQNVTDEFWGLDNVSVTATANNTVHNW